ncbi:hypothetical protein VHUM_00634 [Vanrija humicola]|uniref:DUF1996 domain-containing protein n=1 Tax=Vanrija humicola TaxID=5417 RepID=A0A7D8V320_VANHU|nr:hypothetical protein VHUM_00634 [Vanrija humicola]
MRLSTSFAAIAALALVPSGAVAEFVVHNVKPLVYARLDPIAAPGKVAPHVHVLQGASNIRDVLNTPEEQQNADCTSAIVQGDNSNYWQPALYYINKDNKYEAVPHGMTRVYYRTDGNSQRTQPFPQGLRMISGTAMSRDLSDRRTMGIAINTNVKELGAWLPNSTNHPEPYSTVRLTVAFPSCGEADQSLDSPNHFDHMTWPIFRGGGLEKENYYGGFCPESHPIKYPQLLYEIIYYFGDEQKIDPKRKYNVILSNGDLTGNSLHADFVAGWDMNQLAQAIAYDRTPGQPCNVGMAIDKCPPFASPNVVNIDKSSACRFSGQIPAEEVGLFRPLDQLPGCNPNWAPENGLSKPTNCPWFKGDPGFVGPNAWWQKVWGAEVHPVVALDTPDNQNWNSGIAASIFKSGKMGRWGQSPSGGNNDKVMVGSANDINANKNGPGQRNARVNGMKNSCAYQGQYPPSQCIPKKDQWQTFGPGNVAPTNTPNSIALVCGATNTHGPVMPSDKYIKGPAPIITTAANCGGFPSPAPAKKRDHVLRQHFGSEQASGPTAAPTPAPTPTY